MEAVVKEPLPPDDLRCKRSDGRDWRCKRPSVNGKSYCDSHLYRLSSSKKRPLPHPPNIINNNINVNNISVGNSDSTPTPTRVRIRLRLNPPPDPNLNPSPSLPLPDADTVTVAVAPTPARDTAREEVITPQILGGDVDNSNSNNNNKENDSAGGVKVAESRKGPTVIVRGPREEGMGIDLNNKVEGRTTVNVRVPREEGADMSNVVIAMPAESGLRCRKNSGRGWRCEKTVKEGASLCEAHFSKAKVKRIKVGESKKSKVEDLEGKEVKVSGKVSVSAVPDNERCTKNDGRTWRCKRRVMDGQNMCEAHFKRIKLCDFEGEGGKSGGIRKAVAKVKDKKRKRKKISEKAKGKEKSEGEEEDVKKEMMEVEDGNQLAMVADLAVAEAEGEGEKEKAKEKEIGKEGEKDEEAWRCKRTDGRGWRCKRKVWEGKTMCEIHYEQGRLRQKRITVPEDLKIQRGDGGGEKVEKSLKRKRALEELESNSDKGMKRMKADLIRGFLRREIIEQNKKKKKKKTKGGKSSVGGSGSHIGGEVTRDLPYGLMAIPPAPPAQLLEDSGSLGIKVGVHCSNPLVQRRFRSKNIEPQPVGALKAVPFAENVGKAKNSGKRKCHWCRHNEKSSLVKCLSCRKRFFCVSCIKDRSIDLEEVKLKCPVCIGRCDCKACSTTKSKDAGTKEIFEGRWTGSKMQQLQYLINLLLPIVERINQEQSLEADMEAKFKGQYLSEVEIRQADVGCSDQCSCNNCKSPILDFHRSCPNCSYNLCLSCCREYSQGGRLRGVVGTSFPQLADTTKAHFHGQKVCSEKLHKDCSLQSASSAESTPNLHISCPPMEFGGCDNSLLDLRCIFPLNWTKELEISAKETVSTDDFQQTIDESVPCSLCAHITLGSDNNKVLQEASRRRDSHDNVLYSPSYSDDHHSVLGHFQKHWRTGHPVKVRNVLQCASTLNWDPPAMFCSYLENCSSGRMNMKDATEAVHCSDFYEVEIGTVESFTQSLESHAHRRRETLKVMANLPSTFSLRLLESHYGEIVHSLPLEEYTNPRSGLLNIAGKLPEDFPDSKLGPHVCISFGSREVVARGDLIANLHYNPYDMVNILVHVDSTSFSSEQLNKIKKLIRQNNTKDKGDQCSMNLEKEATRMQSEISVEAAGQDRLLEGTALNNGVNGASCCSLATNDASTHQNDNSPAKLQSSDTALNNGVNDASCCSPATNDASVQPQDDKSPAKLQSSDTALNNGVNDAPCYSPATNDASVQLQDEKSPAKLQSSDTALNNCVNDASCCSPATNDASVQLQNDKSPAKLQSSDTALNNGVSGASCSPATNDASAHLQNDESPAKLQSSDTALNNGVNDASCCSPAANDASVQLQDDKSPTKLQSSDTALNNGVNDAPCCSPATNDASAHLQNDKSPEKLQSSDTALNNGVNGASCSSPATNDASAHLQIDKSPAKLQTSDTDSDTSMICSGTSDSPFKSIDPVFHLERLESPNIADNRSPLDLYGAQWDVFRRQDVPKLIEYIAKHADDLCLDFPKNVVHPIFDGSFYLDTTHKMQLKEEYDIEPWTFKQCVGEAVLIPAGCPYQIRNVKSCVNLAMGFVSPENASECIKLINEIRALPNNHKAKQVKVEVEKMVICSLDEAIKEIYRLWSEGGSLSNNGALMPIANS